MELLGDLYLVVTGFDLNDMGYMKETDYLMNETEIMYRQTDIWKIFRYNAFTLSQKNMWNYGGTPFSNNASLRWPKYDDEPV